MDSIFSALESLVLTEPLAKSTLHSKLELQGKNVAFTGTLPSVARADAKQILEKHFKCKVQSAVTGTTDILIVGDYQQTTSKLQSAKKKNKDIRIVYDEEFMSIIQPYLDTD